MPAVTFRSRFYRFIFERILTSKRLRGVEANACHGHSDFLRPEKNSKDYRAEGVPGVIWFHAASAGELECLWPVILASAEKGYLLCVSVFSKSASRSLAKLQNDLTAYPNSLIYSGFSPWEGEWESFLSFFRPIAFVTAKYEAWPDLWLSLSILHVPLFIVGAKARRSFVVCKLLLSLLGMPVPRLELLVVEEGDVTPLQKVFPTAQVRVTGDPRWDQVRARSSGHHPRIAALLHRFHSCPKPWGALAQVWKEDLQFWESSLSALPGTVWVIPHRLDEKTVLDVSRVLSATGQNWVRSSSDISHDPDSLKFILLDEMGILSELYVSMDWAYVGGGMGQGVHSTIEPAIYGIPIAAGEQGAEKFSEIAQLARTGQLVLFQEKNLEFNRAQVVRWLQVIRGFSKENKEGFIRDSNARMGATQAVLKVLFELAEPQVGKGALAK